MMLQIAFWATVGFIVFGGVLGLIGVWLKDFWRNEVGPKLLITDLILAGTSLAVALVAWLFS